MGKIHTLLVSPHSDDMAMAASHALTQDCFEKPVALCTVFAWSNYAEGQSQEGGHIPFARIREDNQFCDRFGLESFYLGFADEPGTPDPVKVRRSVRQALEQLILKLKPHMIVCPYVPPDAEKQHVHHIIVCDLISDICQQYSRFGKNNQQCGPVLVFTDDLPYSRLS